MVTRLAIVSEDAARASALASLGLPPSASADVIKAEVLRALAWALTGGCGEVHVLRLVNRALELTLALSPMNGDPEQARAGLREALSGLDHAGDLCELRGGRWTPAPTRVVTTGSARGAMLVGGVPTRELPRGGRSALSFDRAFRRLDEGVAMELSFPRERLEDWARRPIESLEHWGRGLLNLDLAAYDDPPEEPQMQVYAPERLDRGAPQFKRWVEARDAKAGRTLGRRLRVFGAREYRLVEVAGGRVVASRDVSASEARRLMYALDSLGENPTTAKWSSSDGGIEVALSSDLPIPEQRMLSTMGSLHADPERPYLRRWALVADVPEVAKVLDPLRVELRENRTRRE